MFYQHVSIQIVSVPELTSTNIASVNNYVIFAYMLYCCGLIVNDLLTTFAFVVNIIPIARIEGDQF